MHKYTSQLILVLAFILTFMPYQQIANSLSLPVASVENPAIALLQVICAGLLWLTYRSTTSRSLKLFWQYLFIAVTCALVSTSLPHDHNNLTQQLTQSFASLFIYFFILLAIETNPHLSDMPLNRYISGRVPAILFTVICFSYFVLLPIEFAENTVLATKPTQLFHILITGLITARLVTSLLNCQGRFWRQVFALLSLSAGFLFVNNIIGFVSVSGQGSYSPGYLMSVSQFAPYFLLVLAANTSMNSRVTANQSNQETSPEFYILLLTLLLVSIHLYGNETQAFYRVDSSLQSIIILLWLFVASLLLLSILHTRKQQSRKRKQKLERLINQHELLSDKNNQLSNTIANSEDKAIVSASNNAILTTTTEGKILSANPAAVQMFQSLEQELIGSYVSRLFSKKDEMHYFFDFQSSVYSLQRKELGISVECTSLRSDGTEFPAQAELQWAEREEQPLIVITFINLSARKLAEKQALELKDKFIANISHEFRTPLTIINGIIDRYLVKTSDEDEIEDLTTAKRNGLRLVRMVEQLLELSRLSDNPQMSLSTYRLKNLMCMPIDSFSRLAKQSKLSFSSKVADNLWLECDAQAFEKIIFNLLANAVKYTPAGGTIQVNVYQEQDTIILDVIDSGIGISKDNQNKIFERFQRADDPNNQSVFGVGIGLSLVNELVKAHGWRISLVSEQGHGSKFSLSMPSAMPGSSEKEMPISLSENEVTSLLTEQRSVASDQAVHSQQVVLVIEDNMDMQSHIKQVVEQQHHCILAGSGELGLELAQEYIPDLIVCDLMLTGIDGFEVLKRLKQDELTAHIPVILLTARSDLESRLQGLNLNADEYLSKPFNHHELLTRIQNLIENRKQLQQSYMQKFANEQKAERRTISHKNAAKLTEESAEEPNLDDMFLSKLEALIAKMYTEPNLDIAMLASKLAMSERQFQRKIKVMLDTTPNNFIKEFRLRKSQELLKNGTQIGRIALDVGFSSQTYFGRCFKESFGCTPKQYQQQVCQQEQAD
mgnify:CR=1 FL=1